MDAVILTGGNVVLEDEVVADGTVAFVNGRIVYAGAKEGFSPELISGGYSAEVLDVEGQWIFPGFIDVHVHGGGGSDAMDATYDALAHIALTHGRHGTTAFLATSMTASHEEVCQAARAVRSAIDATKERPWNGARLVGLHLEGPYLNPERAGAQDPGLMKPANIDELKEIRDILGDDFRLVTIAPEIDGGMEALERLVSWGVIVSLGHTDATFGEAEAAFRAGARHATHMFNGMRGVHHRDPGIAGAALLRPGVLCEVIADGIHLHPDAIRLIYKAKGVDDVCLITDGIEAVDMPPGTYQLGGHEVTVKDGECRLASGALAGSMLTMDRAVGYVVQEIGLPVVDAARMAALNPARQLRMADRKGSLRPGKDADIVVLDRDFRALHTWVEGHLIQREV